MRRWYYLKVKIKDLPINERPRERLVKQGVETLSNEELITLIINSGTQSISAKELSISILKELNDITKLKDISLKQLLDIKGIGIAKATTLLATIELGKRIYKDVPVINNIKFNNPLVIFNYFKAKLINVKQEHFYAVYLDASKKVIEEKLLFIGTVNQSMVHPRDVFKYACILNSSSIICVHNHPSGNTLPSKEDISITNTLINIGKIFNIPVIDHIIIGKDKYYSFYENGDI